MWQLLSILGISALFTALLIYVYLTVTRKRREFIASLGGSGRAVPRCKHALMISYVTITLLWSVFLLFSYLSL